MDKEAIRKRKKAFNETTTDVGVMTMMMSELAVDILADMQPGECEWKGLNGINGRTYGTSCEMIKILLPDYKYCPYCGRKIKVVE